MRPAGVLLVALVACKPDLGPPDSLVLTTRVLAVKSIPAEASPKATVVFRVLVASPDGTIDRAPVVWSFCAAPKPVTENNIVSTACLGWLPAFFGPGPVAAGVLPAGACATFGPDAPPGGFRPRDPDVTGGYFQPVRAALGTSEAFALQRTTCDLANASADVAREFTQKYAPNVNPTLLSPTATASGTSISLDAVQAHARVNLHTGWGAGDAETYVRVNPDTQQVESRRESLRVSWFCTAGVFESDRTGRGEADLATTTDNTWTAPGGPGVVHVWLVLRDSRGGMDFVSADVTVIP